MTANKKNQCTLPPLRQKIDHYSYLGKESIGKGFSSSVYKGRDDHTDQQVAIKIIDLKMMKGQVHKNLLAAQIQILSLIKNKPNLLDVQKICTDKNKTYIITDFCEGGDLGKLIKAKKKMSQSQSIKIIKDVIKGYESLYSLGIVHRDLKPANIFFHNNHSYIGDFGFAIKQQNLRQSEKYNVGSPVYMPPEALNFNKYSHKSDVWAIGVIFYEMLTGTIPWSGRTETELKAKLKTISIRNILPPLISKTSCIFLKRTLESDLTKRMQPYQMFQYFDISHEHDDEQFNSFLNFASNRLFRSMRKSTRSELCDQNNQIRGQSLKKTTNCTDKKVNDINSENVHSTDCERALPKTGMEGPVEKLDNFMSEKRIISKQLLSQVHFCRFLYKLIANIKAELSSQICDQIIEKLCVLLFYKLKQIRQLKLVNCQVLDEYMKYKDYRKLQKLVQQYIVKYSKKLKQYKEEELPATYTNQMYQSLIQDIIKQIKPLFQFTCKSHEPSHLTKQIIVLDCLITLAQLLELLRLQDISIFHNKSKMQVIADGESVTQVEIQHVRLIGNKLRALKII